MALLEENTQPGQSGQNPVRNGKRWVPTQNRIIVEPYKPKEKTASGIYLPDTAQKKQQQAVVLAAGPGRYENGMWVPNSIKAGMVVLFHKHSGYEYEVDGQVLMLITENDVQCVLVDDSEQEDSGEQDGGSASQVSAE